jgi:hypothetical protein
MLYEISTGVNRTQVFWYSFDVGIDIVIGGTAAARWYAVSAARTPS